MKIVIISPAHPYRGGIAESTTRLAQELVTEGHEVIIHTFTLQYPGFLFPGTSQFTTDPAPVGLNIVRSINAVNPLNWIKVGRHINNLKPDLVIVRYWLPFMGPAFGTILKCINGAQKIAITDNVIPHEKRIGDKQLSQYFVNQVDGFVTMSKSVGEELKALTTNKPIVVSMHPIFDVYGAKMDKTEAKAALGVKEDELLLFFFGFIRKYKGLDLLLEAMAHPEVKQRKIKLLVAGEYYANEAEYQQLIQKLGIADQLIMRTDYIPNDQVYKYFSAADCVVQPYLSATQSGISQVAYHFEVPMIVTNVGGLPETVPHDKVGLIAEVNSASIAEMIVKFYDEQKVDIYTENMKLEKVKYSWSYFVEQLMQVYNAIKK